MDQDISSQNLFGLNVDQSIKAHLYETAKWGRFLAIVGFIFCGLIVVLGFVMASTFDNLAGTGVETYGDQSPLQGAGIAMMVVYIFMALLNFFACLFLLRFANKMKIALVADDQTRFNESFQQLKSLFRYVGILTIILIAFYLLATVANLMTA